MFKKNLSSFPVDTKSIYSSLTHEYRISIAIIISLSLLIGNFSFGGRVARAASTLTYSCGTPSANHCYGRNDWTNGVDGSSTTISVRGITGGTNLIDNEMWLQQDSPLYWVEGGYLADAAVDNGAELWFWADHRSVDGSGVVNIHYSSQPISSGDYGKNVSVTIYRRDTSSFYAFVIGAATGIEGTSTPNNMKPNDIVIGQELAGSGGANAPHADFTDNEWEGVGSTEFNYQTVDGCLDVCLISNGDNPPWAGWDQNNRPSNSPYGGRLYTCTLPSSGGKNPC